MHYHCSNQIYTFEPLHALWGMVRWLVGQCCQVLGSCDKFRMAIQNSFRLGCMYNQDKNLDHVWPVSISVKRPTRLTFPVSRAFLNYQVNRVACYFIAFSTAAAPITVSLTYLSPSHKYCQVPFLHGPVYTQNCNDSSWTWIILETHNRHQIPHPMAPHSIIYTGYFPITPITNMD